MTSLSKILNKTIDTETGWFNWKLGTMGGTFAGTVNYFVNDSHGIAEGLRGGGNQFLFNFLLGGANSKLCEYLAKEVDNKYLAIAASSLIPTATSFVVNYLWHKSLQTAEPLDSSIWQIPLNAISTGILGYRWNTQKRNKQNP
ncbi:MAG: hypothetical protein AABW63_01045 [Nanoarchaeota archaeon]